LFLYQILQGRPHIAILLKGEMERVFFYGAAGNGNVVDPGELAIIMNMLLIQM
jgi:hypothetical protein